MFIAILRTANRLEGNRSFCVALNALSPASANDEACRIASALTSLDEDGWVYSVHKAVQAAGDPEDTANHLLALAAGARSGETNEDLARSEGRQSGPKGNAQTQSGITND